MLAETSASLKVDGCKECGAPVPTHQGRGRQPEFCSDGHRQVWEGRERGKRHLRQLQAQMVEFTVTFAPQIEEWRNEVEIAQEAKCAACGISHRRLFMIRTEVGTLVAYCLPCFEERT